jgi:5-methylthioadenosine/S-adenosylhomocysteine deaminase
MTTKQSIFRNLEKPRNILIENTRMMIAPHKVIKGKSMFLSNRKILAIGEKSEIRQNFGSWELRLDASNCLAIPGFVNNHTHIAMALLRGVAEDLPLFNWLRDKIWPIEARLTPQQIEIGATLGAVEALLSGTTTVNTNYIYNRDGSEASALNTIGMRAFVSHGIFDWTAEMGLRATMDLCSTFHGVDDGRIRVVTSPHSPYSCSPNLLKEIEVLRKRLNEKYGKKYPVLSTVHVAESEAEATEIRSRYGVNTVKGVADYLDSLEVLNEETVCAHCVHLTKEDYSAFRKTRASIASCPISNLKVGAGVADLPKAISEGITVSLGTDGPASNNALDMFETMKMASLLAKGLKGDTTRLGAKECFQIATDGGARSLHMEGEIGSLVKGARADLVLVDLSNISALPFYDPFNYLVYAARSKDVRDVLVDGRIVVRDGEIQTVSLENLREAVTSAIQDIAVDIDPRK